MTKLSQQGVHPVGIAMLGLGAASVGGMTCSILVWLFQVLNYWPDQALQLFAGGLLFGLIYGGICGFPALILAFLVSEGDMDLRTMVRWMCLVTFVSGLCLSLPALNAWLCGGAVAVVMLATSSSAAIGQYLLVRKAAEDIRTTQALES